MKRGWRFRSGGRLDITGKEDGIAWQELIVMVGIGSVKPTTGHHQLSAISTVLYILVASRVTGLLYNRISVQRDPLRLGEAPSNSSSDSSSP